MADEAAVSADGPAIGQEAHDEAVHEAYIELDDSEMERIRNLTKSLHSFQEVHEAVKRAICSKNFIEPWNVNYCTIELEKKAEAVALQITNENGHVKPDSANFTADLPDNIRQGVVATDCMDFSSTTGCAQCGDERQHQCTHK